MSIYELVEASKEFKKAKMSNNKICFLKEGYCTERKIIHSECSKSGHNCMHLGDNTESVIKRAFAAGVRWHNDPDAGWNDFKLKEYQNSKLFKLTQTTCKG